MKVKFDKPTLFEDLRYELRLTGKDIAMMLDITPSAYCHLEKGTTWPSFSTLLKLMECFDVRFEEIAEYYEYRKTQLARATSRANTRPRRKKRKTTRKAS